MAVGIQRSEMRLRKNQHVATMLLPAMTIGGTLTPERNIPQLARSANITVAIATISLADRQISLSQSENITAQ